MANHTDEHGKSAPAKSKVARVLSGAAYHSEQLRKFHKKNAVIERGRTKREVKRGRWSGKSARQRVGGTFGS